MDSVADAFLQRFAANVAKLKVGNPAERTTDVGPLARDDLRDALDRQVRESVAQGGRLLLGGYPIARPGYFYAPTILADVTPKEDTNRRWARLGKARSAFALSNLSALLVGGWIAGLG